MTRLLGLAARISKGDRKAQESGSLTPLLSQRYIARLNHYSKVPKGVYLIFCEMDCVFVRCMVQLQPNIAELCPAMVTYSSSDHCPQYKNIVLFLSLLGQKKPYILVLYCIVLNKFIQQLDIALSWEKTKFKFFCCPEYF